MDLERRQMDADRWKTVFEKLDSLNDNQIKQGKDLEHIHNTLFKNNGEKCIVTRLEMINERIDTVNLSVQELKNQKQTVVSTAQAIWAIILGLLSIGSMTTAIFMTIKQLRG